MDEILLNLVEIGGDAEEGGHQVQGEGNPKNTKKTPKKHQQKIYIRWERGRTAIFPEVPLRCELRSTLSKLSASLNAQISETLVMKLENMIYLHLVHHHHFQTSPGIFWFQAQDVQPQWVPQWTRDMQKPGEILLFFVAKTR